MQAFEFEQSGVFSLTPPDVAEIANNAYTDLLPEKSRAIYEKTYSEFMTWCEEKHITRHSETVMLAYFSNIANSSSLIKDTIDGKIV